VEEVLTDLAARVLADAVATNREVLHADTAPPEAVIAAGAGLGLFGGRRLVIVRGLGEAPARVVERLATAIEAARARPRGWPEEGNTVVLVAGGADRRAPALRLVPEAERVEVRAPAGRAVVGWLRERARAAGRELAPAAAQLLVDLVGDDLARLAGELDKAILHAAEDRRISEQAVRGLAGETRVRQYWELTQALEDARRGDALRVLENLLAAGEEPLTILAWVSGYVRTLWRVAGGLAEGAAARQIAGLLRPRRPDFAVERLMARAAAVGLHGVTAGVRRCFEVERAIKTGTGDARPLLTVLVTELAG
jgi:DNA polymerase-3 subunit delta